jgi:uncharacterized protein
MDIQLLQEKREEILAIAAKHGAYNVRVFGSVARGEAKEDSDVDFLVEMESKRSLLDRIALIQDLEDLLARKIDVVKLVNLHDQIRSRVTKESILL